MSSCIRKLIGIRGLRWLAAGAVLVQTSAVAAQSAWPEASDRRCLNCHGQPHIAQLPPAQRRSMVSGIDPDTPTPAVRPGLHVDPQALRNSVHADISCVSCHRDAVDLPHAAELAAPSCGACHEQVGAMVAAGSHRSGVPGAPSCATCHGGHDIQPTAQRESRVHRLQAVETCGGCHAEHDADPGAASAADPLVDRYLDSVHGRAVTEGGLVVAATCIDCHGAHQVLPGTDADSTIHRAQVSQTCGQCHVGVSETFEGSVHGQKLLAGSPDAPVCTDCHSAHAITQVDTPAFIRDIVKECGHCHAAPPDESRRSLYETYRMSYHGQVTALGSTRAASCSDCHGAHDILPVADPASRLSGVNRIETCRECHAGASASFASFQPHADYTDPGRYPLLFGVWLYFILVMSATFGFFGLHSLFWFIRSSIDHFRNGRPPRHKSNPHAIQRFKRIDRVNHALVIITFFGLTLTGMPLLFSDERWARVLAAVFGGVHAAGVWHRVFAVMLIGNFVIHAAGVVNRCRKAGLRHVILGPNSMLPRWRDVQDLMAMLRWFAGGTRPTFDRWTYWEKFDYWAEIFGTFVIGGTGVLLWLAADAPHWLPEWLPGWVFNVATIVHGYEALLAVGFIFTIHFFNAHLRPEKFPVDDVMFTGRLPEEEFQHERGVEYERVAAAGELDSLRVDSPPAWHRPLAVAAGLIAMVIGFGIVALIIFGGLDLL